MYPVVHEESHPNGRHRVQIFRRDDGTYGFWAFEWDDESDGWTLGGHYSELRTDTLERALFEVRARVIWLKQLQPNEEL